MYLYRINKGEQAGVGPISKTAELSVLISLSGPNMNRPIKQEYTAIIKEIHA